MASTNTWRASSRSSSELGCLWTADLAPTLEKFFYTVPSNDMCRNKCKYDRRRTRPPHSEAASLSTPYQCAQPKPYPLSSTQQPSEHSTNYFSPSFTKPRSRNTPRCIVIPNPFVHRHTHHHSGLHILNSLSFFSKASIPFHFSPPLLSLSFRVV